MKVLDFGLAKAMEPTGASSAHAMNSPTIDVSPDCQRFLMIKEGAGGTETAPPQSFVVVEHWFEELTRLVPAK